MNFNSVNIRQLGSFVIFGTLIVGAVNSAMNGSAKHEWESTVNDDRYYLPFFKTKKNQ